MEMMDHCLSMSNNLKTIIELIVPQLKREHIKGSHLDLYHILMGEILVVSELYNGTELLGDGTL